MHRLATGTFPGPLAGACRRSVRAAIRAAACIALALGAAAHAHAAGASRQAMNTGVLKVCSDPSNLPYSNEALEGFENRVVELVADELGLDVAYSWYPQSTGFVRNTLRLRACDVISGITTTSGQVQNTNPYYQSVYTMVYRREGTVQATRMDDLAGRTDLVYGVVAGTPPADVLARLNLLAHVRPYQLVADTRVERPPLQAMRDVADGVTDVAFVWGPIAGWWAKSHEDAGLAVVPLVEETGARMNYRVSMAVRYGETEWKHEVNRALAARSDEIDAVLADYGVPLLDALGRPKAALVPDVPADAREPEQAPDAVPGRVRDAGADEGNSG